VVAGICAFGAPAAGAFGTGGAKGNGVSTSASLSADGSVLAFMSAASNLTPDDVDARDDVFARDTQTGETVLVSRASGPKGANSNLTSQLASISADGRFVAFMSAATNIHPADVDSVADIYVRDLQTDTTILVSRASGPAGAKGNLGSDAPVITPDGRYVTFHSQATTLSPADRDTLLDVYVRDLQAETTTLVSRATGLSGAKGNADSINPDVSDNGRFVAWDSRATNLDPADLDNSRDVYVRDLLTGTTELVSRASGALGAKAAYPNSNFGSANATLSGDGLKVAFGSGATNLDPGDTSSVDDTYLRDLQTDVTTLESRASGGAGVKANGATTPTFLSQDGRYLGLRSIASNLDPDDGSTSESAFVRDLQASTTMLVSRAAGAAGANGNGSSSMPTAITPDGRYVAVAADASNLHPDGALADGLDVFVRDLGGADTYLESRGTTAKGYPRPSTATAVLFAPLVPAYRECTVPNRAHAAPLSMPACAPPDLESDQLTIGTPDANARAATSVGSVRFHVITGDPAKPALDESDVSVVVDIADVRQQAGLGDYGGELSATFAVSLTDRLNGTFRTEPATAQTMDFTFAVPCASTLDPAIGSKCSVATTADTVVPGMVRGSQESIWELRPVRVFDGGSDGIASTSADNTLFAVQGVFVP
jgi:hypothetical protein